MSDETYHSSNIVWYILPILLSTLSEQDLVILVLLVHHFLIFNGNSCNLLYTRWLWDIHNATLLL